MKKEIQYCRQCHKQIREKTYKTQFCSFECYSDFRRESGEYHTGRRQCFCPLCGNVFYPLPGWGKVCCSIKCQKIFERKVDEKREEIQRERTRITQSNELPTV